MIEIADKWTRQPQRPQRLAPGLSWNVVWSAAVPSLNQASGANVAPVAPRQPGMAGIWADYQSTSAAQTFPIPSATSYTLVIVLAHPLANTGGSGRIVANASAGVRIEAFTTGGGVYLNATHTGIAAGVSFVTAVGGFSTAPYVYVITYDGTTQRGWLRDPTGLITEASPATIGIATASQLDIGYASASSCGIYGLAWRRDAVPPTTARALVANPWQLYAKRPRRIFLPVAGGGSYSLTCASGSYTLTGQPVALLASRSLVAAQGSYTLAGQDVALLRLYTLTAAQGAYSLSGQAVALAVSRMLAAGQGSYTLSGQAVALLASRVLAAGQGSYALTGQAVGLTYSPLGSYTLTADAGSYTLTGQAVGLLASRMLTAGQGSYTLTGQAVALAASRALIAGQGSYALTGQDVGLLASRVLVASQGSYALTGQAVGLTYTPAGASYTLTCSPGSYTLTGQAVNFSRNYVLNIAAGSYVLTGQAVTLTFSGAPAPEVYAAISTLRRQMFGPGAATRPAQRATGRRPAQ